MIQAGQRAVEEMGLDGDRFRFDFRDGNSDRFGGWLEFDTELSVAQAEDLTRFEDGLMHWFVVDESAIGRIQVAHENRLSGDQEFAMEAGDRGVVDAEIVGGISAKTEQTVRQFEGAWVGDTRE